MVGKGMSRAGRKLLIAYCVLLLLDVLALAFSARVNIFQEFYFVADLFPFALSIVTLVVLSILIAFLTVIPVSFIARPAFHIGTLVILTIFWLAFNAFSTSRWQYIPLPCSSIPSDYPEERVWCTDVQALKFVVWFLFVGVLTTTLHLAHTTVSQQRHGNRHVWAVPIARFDPRTSLSSTTTGGPKNMAYHARSTSIGARSSFGSLGPAPRFGGLGHAASSSVTSAFDRPVSHLGFGGVSSSSGYDSGNTLAVRAAPYEAARTPGYGTMATPGPGTAVPMLATPAPGFTPSYPITPGTAYNNNPSVPAYPSVGNSAVYTPSSEQKVLKPSYGTIGPAATAVGATVDWFAPNTFAAPSMLAQGSGANNEESGAGNFAGVGAGAGKRAW